MSTVKKLREIAKISAGQSAPQGKDNYCVDGIPFIKAGNLIELLNGKRECDVQNVTESVAKSHKLKLYPAGTVLFAKSGKSCTKGYVYVLKSDCYVVSHLACIIPVKTSGNYLKYYFEYHKPNLLIKDEAYPSISLSDIGNLDITIESHEREKYIVDCLDKVSMLIENQRRQMQKIDELVRSQFIEMFGDPSRNEKGFRLVSLSDIAEYYSGLTYSPKDISDNGTIVLRSSNIQDSELDFSDIVRVSCNIKERLYVKDGDILMCSRNGSSNLVGKVAQIKNLKEEMTFGAFMMIIRSDCPEYLMSYFKTSAFREQTKLGATSTINQITLSMLNNITVPFPPKSELDNYTRFVQQSDKSKFIVEKRLEALNKCYNALLQEFFD